MTNLISKLKARFNKSDKAPEVKQPEEPQPTRGPSGSIRIYDMRSNLIESYSIWFNDTNANVTIDQHELWGQVHAWFMDPMVQTPLEIADAGGRTVVISKSVVSRVVLVPEKTK